MARREQTVEVSKKTLKALHDKLVDGLELYDTSILNEGLEGLQGLIGCEPRRSWGGKRGTRRVYEREVL